MTDTEIAWVSVLLLSAVWALLTTRAGIKVSRSTESNPLKMTWLAALILFPLIGPVAWALWDGWIRAWVARIPYRNVT